MKEPEQTELIWSLIHFIVAVVFFLIYMEPENSSAATVIIVSWIAICNAIFAALHFVVAACISFDRQK